MAHLWKIHGNRFDMIMGRRRTCLHCTKTQQIVKLTNIHNRSWPTWGPPVGRCCPVVKVGKELRLATEKRVPKNKHYDAKKLAADVETELEAKQKASIAQEFAKKLYVRQEDCGVDGSPEQCVTKMLDIDLAGKDIMIVATYELVSIGTLRNLGRELTNDGGLSALKRDQTTKAFNNYSEDEPK